MNTQTNKLFSTASNVRRFLKGQGFDLAAYDVVPAGDKFTFSAKAVDVQEAQTVAVEYNELPVTLVPAPSAWPFPTLETVSKIRLAKGHCPLCDGDSSSQTAGVEPGKEHLSPNKMFCHECGKYYHNITGAEMADKGVPRAKADHSTVEGPCKMVWRIADENRGKTRKEVLALCDEAGIAFYTARTQYQAWRKSVKNDEEAQLKLGK